jgi:NAD(P)-dependent dehydrogenase (short-subunit alcohol dehydrogenase family)
MPASSVFASGSTAVITGAASGIGFAIAQLCHGKGMNVVLVDVNAQALDAAKSSLSGEAVLTHVLDVSISADWSKLKEAVESKFGSVELLVLNAGKGMRGGFGDEEYFRSTLETNLFGVIRGINTFLPVVKKASESKQTAIVITGSKQGITNPPGNPAYNASKAAVKSLAEQLSYDLKGSNTSVHLLVPGWTFTGMVSSVDILFMKLRFADVTRRLVQDQIRKSQLALGHRRKLSITCTRRWSRTSSMSSAQTTMYRKRRIRSACCGRWAISSRSGRL